MTNNDVLRKIRYTFDYSDSQMISLFKEGNLEVDRAQVSNWLKREDDPDYKNLFDKQLAHFLNGFIVEKRGKREGPAPIAEKSVNNNLILRKLKIALNLRDEDIIALLDMVDIRVSRHEISSFFRKPGHGKYRLCMDQFLRNLLMGIQLKYHKK